MARILVTFLGRSSRRGDFYQPAAYDFGESVVEATFMADALVRRFRAAGRPFDRIVLLGTAGSMWDALAENLNPDDSYDELRVRLIDLVNDQAVTQDDLLALQPLFKAALRAVCNPVIIDAGRSTDQQVGILSDLLAATGSLTADDEIVLDVTHGFRHLSMLSIVAVMYFEVTYGCRIAGIFYGALEMARPAPVIRLDGLVLIGRWIRALHGYDRDADPTPFVGLLRAEKAVPEDAIEALRHLAFFEQTNQIERAAEEGERFRAQSVDPWPGVSKLFRERLLRRLPSPGQSTFDLQRELAYLHLEHGDYLRAAILGFEAFVTRLTTDAGKQSANYRNRETARKSYEDRIRDLQKSEHRDSAARTDLLDFQAFDSVRQLRNALAHGTSSDVRKRRIREALDSPQTMTQFLRDRLSLLLGGRRDRID